MRLAITLTRTGDTWQVQHLPSVPLSEQLADFKAKQVAGDFGNVSETVVVSLGDTLKKHTTKLKPASEPVEIEDAPKTKKK
jgi:hypothetical protein